MTRASELEDRWAIIEDAKLLWKGGHERDAIKKLQDAIESKTFMAKPTPESSRNTSSQARNLIPAKALLLRAKWQDSSGFSQTTALRQQYQAAAKAYPLWEKGHYYLGRYYKKILDSEKAMKPDDQSDEYLSGETAKLVIENYLRSLNLGTKYLYLTLPRILTLWLELGAQLNKAPEGKISLSRELYDRRNKMLNELHKSLSKHIQRLPAYIFYTALPQIVARITHPNSDVFELLEQIIIKVMQAYPRQALWSLFGCMTVTKDESTRKTRGSQMFRKLQLIAKKAEADLRLMLRGGQKLAEQLLLICNNGEFPNNKTTRASLTRDLRFNEHCTPCPLVLPAESCLTATLPTATDTMKKHKAFANDAVTIDSFLDEVLVLGSLAKPRKVTIRGSDGQKYAFLLKPKDDLRTDQRLMEVNHMIDRSLKREAESSRRQLYIRTYAVTPLNEECGIIEWVGGGIAMREILLKLYKERSIMPDYTRLAANLKEAASSDDKVHIFTDQILSIFPPVLPEWFVSQFPNPPAWLAARLRYTRTCAVMSMVGTILGLGDRHGENVLLEEGNGGIFHVDFNCLFDKGRTFAQPECVPFRMTHNMVAAMGIHGYEGPFRQCSELTLRILRQQEETLMSILEAFIYDPTLDLQRAKRRKNEVVQLNPTSVVESIKRKVSGLLNNETIPLSVEGQVEELIKQAVSPRNLASMYIGWCSFF
jgi:serine/threonine-protein kinase ATR